MNPDLDPDLAMALMYSRQEEEARKKKAEEEKKEEPTPEGNNDVQMTEAPAHDEEEDLDEEALL